MLLLLLYVLAVPNISLSVLKPHFPEILLESHIVMIRVRNNAKLCLNLCLKDVFLSEIIYLQKNLFLG